MEYSIGELSEIAGVSARTLRYYDEIGLLKPLYVSEAGYRFYGENEIAVLQQILFYRARGFDLRRIRKIIYQDDFDIMNALEEHLHELEEQRNYTDSLIRTVKQTILAMKGESQMSDKEKFEAFKERVVREHEEHYGAEARKKYGDAEIEEAHRKVMEMSETDWERMQSLGEEIRIRLEEGVRAGIKPDSEEAKRIVVLHKEWLGRTWKQYKAETHKAMADLYEADERFRRYYDRNETGCAELLVQAIRYWVPGLH